MSAVRAALRVWRRELQITLRAPILYVIGGLFLAVQGVAFAGLVSALSDPSRPAPLGALLEGQLAGTLLTWVLQLVVLTLLGMRTVAEDKRTGSWELLLTAQIGEGAAVVGKWLAAVTVYALLWIPTLAYLLVVSMFRVDQGGWDVPSIVIGYAGAIAIGAALLAWAVAASASTSNTLVAGGFAFALLIGIFLVGELPVAFGDFAVDHPSLARALEHVSLRSVLTRFARGEISASAVAFVGGLALAGLSLAIAFACLGRRRRREVQVRFGATALVAACATFVGVLSSQHPLRWDASAARRNSLDPLTQNVLRSLPGPATLTIVEPTLGALAPIYAEVSRVANMFAEEGTVRVLHVDPASVPGGLDAAARIAGVMPADLATHGGVVVELGGRRRVVDRVQLVSIARDDEGTAAVERLGIERSITGALAELSLTAPVDVCATSGHRELPLDAAEGEADWNVVVERLRGDGMQVRTFEGARVPSDCDVVIVAGPTEPLSNEAALGLQQFLSRGGGLLVAAASRPVTTSSGGTTLAATGLEGLLASVGIGLPPAIVVDPSLTVRELPGALLVVDGYSAHPINVGFPGTRPTLWFQPRAVLTTRGATPLVAASAESWGERDIVTAPPQKDDDDLAPPVVLAALGAGARVIAVGSAESFTSAVLHGGASAGDLWLATAIRQLSGTQGPGPAIAPRPAEQVRLLMTDGQRRTVTALCIAGIPLAWIVIGALLLVLRRRPS